MTAINQAKYFIEQIAPAGMSQTDIVNTVKGYGPGRNTTLAALNEMVNNGAIIVEEGHKDNAKLYTLS